MTSFSEEERRLLDDSLQSYFARNYAFDRWREIQATPGSQGSDKEWRDYAELGWLGLPLPEDAGGTGCGMTELGILMAAAGRHLALEPLLGTIVLGARVIEVVGSVRQRGALLPRIAAGEMRIAFCHAEPDAGYARDFVQTVALSDGEALHIHGAKSFALGAHSADLMIVSARLGGPEGPVRLFLVPRDRDGIAFNTACALDGRCGATTRFDRVRIDSGDQLGDGSGDLLPIICDLIDRGAIAISAEACGAMATAVQMTTGYLKVREQFGQPLARFQVLQHRLVDMCLALEEARAIVHAALDAIDTGHPDAQRTVWQAKVVTAQSARFVGAQSLQLHGGIGMTDELAIGHYYKRLAVCENQFGDADWYLSQLARSSG